MHNRTSLKIETLKLADNKDGYVAKCCQAGDQYIEFRE